jgi:hypothetical protein
MAQSVRTAGRKYASLGTSEGRVQCPRIVYTDLISLICKIACENERVTSSIVAGSASLPLERAKAVLQQSMWRWGAAEPVLRAYEYCHDYDSRYKGWCILYRRCMEHPL